ncbi:MAG TPA: glycosyltransferase [Mucilaginibacter sp.]
MEPINILVTLPNDTMGGAEQYLNMITRYFAKQNCAIYVLFLKKQNDNGWQNLEDYDNVHLRYTNSSSEKKGIWLFFRHLISLRKISFEYIFTSHVHLTGMVGLFVRLGLLKKRYFIGRESTSIFLRFKGLKLAMFKLQYWMGYSAVDLLICQTQFMKEQLVNAIPWLEKKTRIVIIPNPINLDAMNPGEMDKDELRLYGNFIVSAGRLIPEKGYDMLISVFARIKKQFPHLKLLILGEGKKRAELTALIQEMELTGDVFLPGFANNVYKYFKYAELCVVSSRIEGFPNVLLQMMSQNDKVVSTKCAGGIEDIEGVITADTHNEESLENAMLAALGNDTKENRSTFDKQLKERSLDRFIEKIHENLS